MNKKRKILIAVLVQVGIVVIVVLTSAALVIYRSAQEEQESFQNVEIIAAGTQDSTVQGLSAQFGIALDPALEQHAYLLENRDRIVIHSGAVAFEEMERSSGYILRVPAENRVARADAPVHVYTGTLELEGRVANIALIDAGPQPYDGLPARGLDVIVQMRSLSGGFASGQRGIRILSSAEGGFWSVEKGIFFCLRSADDSRWGVLRSSAKMPIALEPFPASFGESDSSGIIDLVQLCGRIVFSTQDDSSEIITGISLVLGELTALGDGEFWDITIIYPPAMAA